MAALILILAVLNLVAGEWSVTGRRFAIDMLLGTVMLGSTVKLLLSVMVYNRRISQALNALVRKKAKAHPTDEPNGDAPRQPS